VATTHEEGFLKAIEDMPDDVTSRQVYADWLEEQGRPYEAMQQRVLAGVSEARFKIRRKSDRLFSEGGTKTKKWSATGKEWRRLDHLRSHLTAYCGRGAYEGTPWADLEIVVYEVRPQAIASLRVDRRSDPARGRRLRIFIEEPAGPSK
jgi:uncharacterized protein (TIGR02996 family)